MLRQVYSTIPSSTNYWPIVGSLGNRWEMLVLEYGCEILDSVAPLI